MSDASESIYTKVRPCVCKDAPKGTTTETCEKCRKIWGVHLKSEVPQFRVVLEESRTEEPPRRKCC